MKQIILTFGLVLTGLALFSQSPRIRLNQITKDSLTGSVVLSGSDSNMVYSRDFFLNFQDSVLIVFGDTLSTTATAFTGVATDLTLTGNGTVGNELKVDTAIIATVSALADSLAGIISSVTTDLTLTGDGSVATPLKVDTAVIATIRALSDSLATLSFATNQDISDSLATLSFASLQDITDTLDLNTRDYITGLRLTDTLNLNSRGFLTQNQTITLTNDATGSGTTSISVTVVDDSHNHTITTLTGIQDSLNSKAALVHTHTISDVAFLQDSLDAKANDADLNNYLLTSNYIVDSTRINLTGDTAYYYQNGVLIGTGAIAGGGGGGSGTVTSITAGTYLSGGTITTSGTIALDTASAGLKTYIGENIGTVDLSSEVTGTLPVANGGTGATTLTSGAFLNGNGTSAVSGSSNLSESGDTVIVAKHLLVDTTTFFVDAVNNRVGIGQTQTLTGSALSIRGSIHIVDADTTSISDNQMYIFPKEQTTAGANSSEFQISVAGPGSSNQNQGPAFIMRGNTYIRNPNQRGAILFTAGRPDTTTATGLPLTGRDGQLNFISEMGEIHFNTGGFDTVRMVLKNNGNVGIGTTAPAYTLDVVGDINASGEVRNSGVILTSDARYKKDINSLQNASYKLMELNPVSYYWNELMLEKLNNSQSKTKQQIKYGLIAQEVELNFPEFVSEGQDGFKAIDYQAVISLILKGWQEQQTIIETQQQEIETLKTQIQNILTEINNLKNN